MGCCTNMRQPIAKHSMTRLYFFWSKIGFAFILPLPFLSSHQEDRLQYIPCSEYAALHILAQYSAIQNIALFCKCLIDTFCIHPSFAATFSIQNTANSSSLEFLIFSSVIINMTSYQFSFHSYTIKFTHIIPQHWQTPTCYKLSLRCSEFSSQIHHLRIP